MEKTGRRKISRSSDVPSGYCRSPWTHNRDTQPYHYRYGKVGGRQAGIVSKTIGEKPGFTCSRNRLIKIFYVDRVGSRIRGSRRAVNSSAKGNRNSHQCRANSHHDQPRSPGMKPCVTRKKEPAQK